MSDGEPCSILEAPWSGMSLPGLVRGAALLRAETVLFRDGEASLGLAHRPALALTGQDLDDRVDALTRKLILLGLEPGNRVLVMLPNIVEAAVTLLAVMRAGGVAVALPVFADLETVTAAALLTEASGMVTLSAFAGLRPAETARTVAAAALSVRFVAAHGTRAPEGVCALDGLSAGDVEGIALPLAPTGAMDALVTLDTWHGAPRAVCRTHEQLIAEAAAAVAQARLRDGMRIITTIAPASIAGVTLGVGMPLLSGATTDLNPLFDTCGFAAQLGEGGDVVVVLPAAAERAYADHCAGRRRTAETLMLVHRPDGAGPLELAAPAAGAGPVVDLVCLGEMALLGYDRDAARALDAVPAAPIYPVPGVLRETASGYLFGTPAKGREMLVSGPLAPRVVCLGDSAGGVILPRIATDRRRDSAAA